MMIGSDLTIRNDKLMARKTVKFSPAGITKLPEDKPVVYKVESKGGKNNYTGVAKRGRVQARISEHLPEGKDPVPGTKVMIEQMSTIAEAERKEARVISRSKPKYNKAGK